MKVVDNLDEFKVFVTVLPKNQGTRFEGEDLKTIQLAKGLMEIFTVLNQYWNFTSYDLLEAVVEAFGDENAQLQRDMRQYSEEMQVFESETHLHHLSGLQLCNPRPNSCPVVAHLVGNCSERTLADVQLCRQCIARGFDCDKSSIRSSSVDTGSVVLTFLVPWSIAGAMIVKARSKEMHGLLRLQGILQLSIGGMCIYDSEEDMLKVLCHNYAC